MKVGFTGTQVGMSDSQKEKLEVLLKGLNITEFHHGDCIGADAEAHEIANDLGLRIVIHPPTNSSKRAYCIPNVLLDRKPYIERNHDIVDSCDLLVATPKSANEELRSGTWATIRYARKVNREVRILV